MSIISGKIGIVAGWGKQGKQGEMLELSNELNHVSYLLLIIYWLIIGYDMII